MKTKDWIYLYFKIFIVLLVGVLIAKTWCDSENAKHRYRMTWDSEYREFRKSVGMVEKWVPDESIVPIEGKGVK